MPRITFGTNASETLNGDASNNLIFARGGHDVVNGGAGDDLIRGGLGRDSLYGDDGDDRIGGGRGADLLEGGAGDDVLRGGAGDDNLYGGTGDDALHGGAGNDTDMVGGAGNDVLDGGAGDDRLAGAGPGTITYGFGDTGGTGDMDVLTGGTGADTFVLGSRAMGGTPGAVWYVGDGDADHAEVTDFDAAEDTLEMAAGYDYVSLEDGSDTKIYLDSDGDGAGDDLIAVLNGVSGFDLAGSYVEYV